MDESDIQISVFKKFNRITKNTARQRIPEIENMIRTIKASLIFQVQITTRREKMKAMPNMNSPVTLIPTRSLNLFFIQYDISELFDVRVFPFLHPVSIHNSETCL